MSKIDLDGLDSGVAREEKHGSAQLLFTEIINPLVQRVFAKLATNTRLFESAERNLCMKLVHTVDLVY
jgi:hypothetical protein